MSISTRIVRIVAGSLPKSMRERYREQWLADIRDAPELNLRPAQIALGSIAFAATTGRHLPTRPMSTSSEIERRVRMVRALALSAALLGLSQWASMFNGDYLGEGVPDERAWALTTFLIAFVALASVLALILAFLTRGVKNRTRWAVVLFAVAGAAPIVQSSLASAGNASWQPALHASAIPYLVAVILVLVGVALLIQPRRAVGRHLRASIVAGGVVLLVAAGTLVNAVILWSLRAPLRFGNGPRNANNPIYVEWARLKGQFEALMTSVFTWWGIGVVALVVTVVVFAILGRLSRRHIIRLAAGAVALTLLAGGSLLGFLQLAETGIVPIPESSLMLTAARLLIVVTIMSSASLAAGNGDTTPVTGRSLAAE